MTSDPGHDKPPPRLPPRPEPAGEWITVTIRTGVTRQDWIPAEQPPSPDGAPGRWHVVNDQVEPRWEWHPQIPTLPEAERKNLWQRQQARHDALMEKKAVVEVWRQDHPAEKTMNRAAMAHLWTRAKMGLTTEGPVLGAKADLFTSDPHLAWTATRVAGGVATMGLSLAAGRKHKGAAVINLVFADGSVKTYTVKSDPASLRDAATYVAAFNVLAEQLQAEHAPTHVDPGSRPQLSVADELRKLADLRRDGVLTDAEFAAQKAQILGSDRS